MEQEYKDIKQKVRVVKKNFNYPLIRNTGNKFKSVATRLYSTRNIPGGFGWGWSKLNHLKVGHRHQFSASKNSKKRYTSTKGFSGLTDEGYLR